jgi:hypothetical protein
MIKVIVLTLSIICGTMMTSLSLVHATDILGPSAQCGTNSDTSSSAICTDDKTESAAGANDNPIADRLRNIANLIAIVAGAAAILLILVGGIQYVTSNGDTNKTASAKNTVIYSLVGLVVVALAAAIIDFVVSKL